MSNQRQDWSRFALVLIDVQRDFFPEKTARDFPDFAANTAYLLDFCRSTGLEVVHLRAAFEPDRSDWMPIYRLRGRIPCVLGTPGAEVLPFAQEQPGEVVITKHSYDGFQNTGLLAYLHERRKRFVLAAGLVTSVCVFLTAASAMQNGFLAAVVEDCCADDPAAHHSTLERYGFMFDRATLDLLAHRHTDWLGWLAELDQPRTRQK